MAILVIAGSRSGAGKTAVACALVAALPEIRWIGVKVTPHVHPALEESPDSAVSMKDTERYYAAGAEWTALISNASKESAEQILSTFRPWPGQTSLLVESNGVGANAVARPGEPTLTLAILAGPPESWKPSLSQRLPGADALILAAGLTQISLPSDLQHTPSFCLPDGQWSTPELIEFVRSGLSA